MCKSSNGDVPGKAEVQPGRKVVVGRGVPEMREGVHDVAQVSAGTPSRPARRCFGWGFPRRLRAYGGLHMRRQALTDSGVAGWVAPVCRIVSLGGSAHLGWSPRRVASGGTLAVTLFG